MFILKLKTLVASKFIHSMNEILPKDISVSDLKEVSLIFMLKNLPESAHTNTFFKPKVRTHMTGDLMLIKYKLNTERMQKALGLFAWRARFFKF